MLLCFLSSSMFHHVKPLCALSILFWSSSQSRVSALACEVSKLDAILDVTSWDTEMLNDRSTVDGHSTGVSEGPKKPQTNTHLRDHEAHVVRRRSGLRLGFGHQPGSLDHLGTSWTILDHLGPRHDWSDYYVFKWLMISELWIYIEI